MKIIMNGREYEIHIDYDLLKQLIIIETDKSFTRKEALDIIGYIFDKLKIQPETTRRIKGHDNWGEGCYKCEKCDWILNFSDNFCPDCGYKIIGEG